MIFVANPEDESGEKVRKSRERKGSVGFHCEDTQDAVSERVLSTM